MKIKDRTVLKNLGFCGFGGGTNTGCVDVMDGKVVRIRPLHYDEYYTPTVDNMVSAAAAFGYKLTISTGVGIAFDTEWDEGYFITF